MAKERTLTLRDGGKAPWLGQGTWYLGESAAARQAELKAPRTGSVAHAAQNAAAADLSLAAEEWEALNRAFPAPQYREPLDIV